MTDQGEMRTRRESWFNWPRGIGAALIAMAGIGALNGTVNLASILFAGVGIWLFTLGTRRR